MHDFEALNMVLGSTRGVVPVGVIVPSVYAVTKYLQ